MTISSTVSLFSPHLSQELGGHVGFKESPLQRLHFILHEAAQDSHLHMMLGSVCCYTSECETLQ